MEKETISLGGTKYWLCSLSNCDSANRFDLWMKEVPQGLSNNRSIGCGLNALTFLGVFSINEGTQLVNVISRRGTTFEEMIKFAWNKNTTKYPIIGFPHSINTIETATEFTNTLQRILPDNHCTVAKLMRYPDDTPEQNVPLCSGNLLTSGHSIVFGKNNNTLYVIDPQQGTNRKHDVKRAFKSWQIQCYKAIYLMFTPVPNSQPVKLKVNENMSNIPLNILPDHGVPMDVDENYQQYLPEEGVQMDVDENYQQYIPEESVQMDVSGGKKSKKNKKSRKNRKNRKNKKSKKLF